MLLLGTLPCPVVSAGSAQFRQWADEPMPVIAEVHAASADTMTKCWRVIGETHGIPHRYGHHSSRRN